MLFLRYNMIIIRADNAALLQIVTGKIPQGAFGARTNKTINSQILGGLKTLHSSKSSGAEDTVRRTSIVAEVIQSKLKILHIVAGLTVFQRIGAEYLALRRRMRRGSRRGGREVLSLHITIRAIVGYITPRYAADSTGGVFRYGGTIGDTGR